MSKKRKGKKECRRILGAAVLMAGFVLWMICIGKERWQSTGLVTDKTVVLIDPGHGDMDPGKVGINGALEKDINLAIAVFVKENLEKAGVFVVMTREKDTVNGPGQAQHYSKLDDLKKRVALMEACHAQFAVSIHQNSFTKESVSGSQVFYHVSSQEGKRLAQEIQTKLSSALKESNPREIKENHTYYLLKKATIPVVIVECGFLSNQIQAENLVDETYQKQVAAGISEGILNYLKIQNKV